MLGAAGIFSLGAAVGSGAPIFIFFTLMFLAFGYSIQKSVQWTMQAQEESAV
jgi:hypothetical protein